MSGATQVVFLTSPPYSGSTLFSFLVNTHPHIATVGEATGPAPSQDSETYRCSCGQKIKECPFWRKIVAKMADRGFLFDVAKFETTIRLGDSPVVQQFLSGSLRFALLEDIRDGLLGLWPKQKDMLRHLVARYVALAESVLQVTGKAVFFDASKNPMVIRQLAHRSDIELRVVHLVRDVRGASLSKRKNQGEMNWCQAVNSWVRMNRNIERQLLRIPRDRWIRIRYEDLCRDPAGTLDRFLGFCGLPARVMPGNFGSHEHHIVGNRMRLTNVADISLDEGWRRSLTPSELADAWALAGLLNSRYGYPPMRTSDLIS